MNPTQRLTKFSWGVVGYTLAVIVWGAFVRATGSGAGCGEHWPLCNGTALPRSPGLETMIEFSHRITSGLSLLLIVALALAVFRSRPKGHLARKAAVWSVVFILTEALIGAGLVLLGLVAKDKSMLRAASLAMHLTNTFVLLGWLAAVVRWSELKDPVRRNLPRAAEANNILALLLTTAIGISGGIAALGDTLFPSTGAVIDAIQADFSSASHWLIKLRMWHPFIAVGASAYLVFFARQRAGLSDRARKLAWSLMGAIGAQISLGILNVALLAPVWIQLVHLFLADALWFTLVLLVLESQTTERI